jgi:hypothetical protein
MKTIESQLDLFFQRLGHTPGPWTPASYENDTDPCRLRSIHATHNMPYLLMVAGGSPIRRTGDLLWTRYTFRSTLRYC